MVSEKLLRHGCFGPAVKALIGVEELGPSDHC